MSLDIETARTGAVPRGEATARIELAALSRRLVGANDPERSVAEMMDDVAAVWHKCKADLDENKPKGESND